MPNVDLVFLPLLATALIFAIIELGLSAYTDSIATQAVEVESYDPCYAGCGYGGYDFNGATEPGDAPGSVKFLVFASIWTMVITPALAILPMLGHRYNKFWIDSSGNPAAWVAPLTLALNAVTMIFWLAGFAALANLFGGIAPQGIAGALLAFAVMLWLVFLALLVFNLLTAFGILKSDRIGYDAALFKNYGSRRGLGAHSNSGDAEKTQETSSMPPASEVASL